MMQFFRSIAKPLILVTAIAFFVWLVVDLSGLSGGGGLLTRTSVGKVNGTSVDLRTFQANVQQATQDRQSRTGSTLGLEEQAEIRDQVWEQAIQEIIFRAEYDRYGIRASDEEVASAIRSSPPQEFLTEPMFQTDGKFDPEKYSAWLSSSSGQGFIPVLEQRYREQILRGKLFQRVIADVTISDPLLWERFRDQKETVRVGILTIDPAVAVPDSAVAVDRASLERYYQDHKKDFERKPAAFVSYVALPRTPNQADTAEARQRALSLRAEIAGGVPFAEVARRESADTVSGRKGGELDEMRRSAVDSAFGAAVMSLPLHRVSEPVLSRFGFHLIEVESRKGDTFKARHILIPIEVTGSHRDLLDRQADSLEKLAAERLEGTALDTAARALGIPIGKAGPLVQGLVVSLPEAGQVPDVSIWAFQAKRGEHSPVIEAERAFIVFRLDSVQRGGVPPLAEVRGEVEARVRLEKKLEVARAIGERVAAQARGTGGSPGTPLWQLATQPGFSYRTEGPFARLGAPFQDPALVGAAFGAPAGGISGPVAGTDLRVYLFQVLERVPADSAEFTKSLPVIRGQALQAARQSRVQAYLADLRSRAKIVDRRAEVFTTNAQSAAAQPAPVR
jgi:peptidyl-prolyl cis-trans isomerase D